MNSKNYFVTSDDGRKYKIPDINNFFKHLTDFHTENGHGNKDHSSLYMEIERMNKK